MSCLSIHRIYEYLENQLPEPQKAECEAHLEECPRCRRLVENRRRFLNAADTLPELTLPENFPLQVMTRIKSEESLAGKWFWLGIGAAIPLSFVLIGIFLVSFGPLKSWTGIIESLVNIFRQGAFTLIKGLKLIVVFLQAMAGFIRLLLEKFGSLASLAPPETPFVASAVIVLIAAVFFFEMSRKSRLGARK